MLAQVREKREGRLESGVVRFSLSRILGFIFLSCSTRWQGGANHSDPGLVAFPIQVLESG